MFSNHQGRYDPMGIIAGHERPCSFLVDKRRANQFLGKQFSALLDGISIDKESVKDQMRAMRALAFTRHGLTALRVMMLMTPPLASEP